MTISHLLEQFPDWLLSTAMAIVVVASVQAGIRFGQGIVRKQDKPDGASEGIGTVVGALLGLLAFMMAFTFGLAANRRDARKELLLDEVKSIGTTFLRAGFLDEPARSDSRELLRRYVELRIDAAENPGQVSSVLADCVQIQQRLWSFAEALANAELKNPDIMALYVDSLNETIDLHTSRLTVSRYRIPETVWVAFGCLIVITSVAVGFNFGLHSCKRHWMMTFMLAVSFATVAYLIFDLDRGNQGWLKVDQQPMRDLRQQMGG